MVSGEASGRGLAYFLDTPEGGWVLRHYRRGGLLRGLLGDHYAWLGAERSRPFREWRMLATLVELGLPVPAPVAARLVRDGIAYRADLITVRVPGAVTLAQTLAEAPQPVARWRSLGAVLARFHDAGVWHADLNAHNVLLDALGRFRLIDFDHSRVRHPGRWRERNLARLRRSLDKLAAERPTFHFVEADWSALRDGYLQSD